MKLRSWTLATAAACAASFAFAGPPLAKVWNIAPTGQAGSSGDLHFRIHQRDGSDPVDITVPIIVGAKDQTVARSIRNSLASQLRRDRFKVELGEGTNVLVSDKRGQPNFAIELVDSDIENLRVAVQSVTPIAPPTVPEQSAPAPAQSPSPMPAAPPGNPPPVPGPPPAPAPAPAPSPGQAAPQPGPATQAPGSGMGIPEDPKPRLPNTSPPANRPVQPPPPQPDPASPPPSKPPPDQDSSGGASAPPPLAR